MEPNTTQPQSQSTSLIPDTIHVKLLTETGTKEAQIRFPTDNEWITRQNRRPMKFKVIGRNNTTAIDVDHSQVDLDLYNQIRQEGSPELDAYEAAAAIDKLAACTVTDVVQEGTGFKVTLLTIIGEVSCSLHVPSLKASALYKKNRQKPRDLPYSYFEVTVSLSAGRDLFDQVCEDPEKSWPIIWKVVAVDALSNEIDTVTAGNEKRDFF